MRTKAVLGAITLLSVLACGDVSDIPQVTDSEEAHTVIEVVAVAAESDDFYIPKLHIENSVVITKEDIYEQAAARYAEYKASLPEPEPEPEPEEPLYEYYDKWFWVGDSRIVGMSGNVGIAYMAKSAMGLDWFWENAQTVYDLRECNVVFNLGINDYWRVYDYIAVYNSMPDEFTQNNKIFIMSINPVDEGIAYYLNNGNYENFNQILRDNLREDYYYLDCYSYLQETGFGTLDGIHYDGATNVKIYSYVIDTITEKGVSVWK